MQLFENNKTSDDVDNLGCSGHSCKCLNGECSCDRKNEDSLIGEETIFQAIDGKKGGESKKKAEFPKSYSIENGKVVGVCLSYYESVFYFEAGNTDLYMNSFCVVNLDKTEWVGKITTPVYSLNENHRDGFAVFGKVIRAANKSDLARHEKNKELEARALSFCKERAGARNLKMRLVKVLFRIDRSKAIFFFTADGRIDFRELVKDLAGEFHTRIEMKQIGVRDEARLFGGVGSCGRNLCCSAYLKEFLPVSIRMAKAQQLTLDPEKISGLCGRLMCCLEYEYGVYSDARKNFPKNGKKVVYKGEIGKVVNSDVLRNTVFIECVGGKIFQAGVHEIEQVKGNSAVKEKS